ncbi:putative adipose-regulatory protein-domain-containing protein [Hypoxylon sp. NC1633]|nr:putative adipose-regulatory protein-domain-containing protein [Hypoxylon sp. NC1633]
MSELLVPSHIDDDVDSSSYCSSQRGSWSGSGVSAAKSSADDLIPVHFNVPHTNDNKDGSNVNITCLDSETLVFPALCHLPDSTAASSETSNSRDSRGSAPDGASASTSEKMQYVKGSYRAATSPKAQRTYLSAVLFLAASLALLCIAALAYPIFYYNYVPKKVISIPVHLQYNSGPNPYGITSLSSNLMLEQAYDVSVELTLPRSPANLGRGNFMVALFGMRSMPGNPAFAFSSLPLADDLYTHVREDNVVFMSRRPALIPYESPLVTTTSRVLFMLYHILYPGSSETTTLAIPMGELVQFKDVLPLSIMLDVQGGQTLQVYSATVTLVARLTGIRWAMYNHRIISFVVCTTVFWIAEMISTGLAWLFLSHFLSGQNPDAPEFNREIYVGGSRMGPLDTPTASFGDDGAGDSRNEGDLRVKKEEEGFDDDDVKKIKDESPERETLADHPADDEEDGEDLWRESGTAGTSFSHHDRAGSLRRRSSRGTRA